MAVWSWWWTLWSSRRWWQWKDEKPNLADASSMTKAMQEATKRDQERERPYSAPALCREESFFAQKNRSSVDYHHHYCILLSLPCADNDSARSNATSRKHWPIEEGSHLGEPIYQEHHELSGKNDENKSFQPNQIAPSIYIMIELCFFSLDQWEIKIHLLWGKCFNIPHHCDPHLNQTK